MVTASKVAAAQAGPQRSDAASIRGPLGMQESSDFQDSDSEMSQPPPDYLPFGEQLVLETYMRFQRRPLDKQRLEDMARPKRHGPAVAQNMLIGVPTKTASPEEIAGIVGRLTQPKKSSAAVAETTLSMASNQPNPARKKDFNLDAMVSRLTAPRRVVQPTPAEEVVLQAYKTGPRRGLDPARLAEMAKPHRRGASCLSWGVNPEWVKDVSSCLDTPRASRSIESAASRFHTLGANIMATPRTPSTADSRSANGNTMGLGFPTTAQDYAPRQPQPQQRQESREQPQAQPQPLPPKPPSEPVEPDSPQNGPDAPWKQPQNAAWEMHLQEQERQREVERQQRRQRREEAQPPQPQPNRGVDEEDQALLRLLMEDEPLDGPSAQPQADAEVAASRSDRASSAAAPLPPRSPAQQPAARAALDRSPQPGGAFGYPSSPSEAERRSPAAESDGLPPVAPAELAEIPPVTVTVEAAEASGTGPAPVQPAAGSYSEDEDWTVAEDGLADDGGGYDEELEKLYAGWSR